MKFQDEDDLNRAKSQVRVRLIQAYWKRKFKTLLFKFNLLLFYFSKVSRRVQVDSIGISFGSFDLSYGRIHCTHRTKWHDCLILVFINRLMLTTDIFIGLTAYYTFLILEILSQIFLDFFDLVNFTNF